MNLKEKLLKKQVEKIQQSKSLADFIRQLKYIVGASEPILKKEGIEVKILKQIYEGKIWDTILLRETKDGRDN